MADTVVNFLLEKLLQLVTEEAHLIAGVEEEFQDLYQQVRILSSFIEDYGKLVWDSNMWKEMDKAIRITVYKTEDTIDKFLVEARLHQDKSRIIRLVDFVYLQAVRDLSIKIKGIIKEIKRIPQGDRQALPPAENLRLEIETEKGGQEPTVHSLEDDVVVGFEEEAKIVIERLIEGSKDDLDVIPIVGMPGLGKTTLARKIFNDTRITYEFFNIIWVHVGQLYRFKDIVLQIVKCFSKITENYQYMDAHELAEIARSFMEKGGRCLIVLDDVWSPEVVEPVMRVFPKNLKGHRIMITTRDRSVACYANDSPLYLRFLTSEESFELLRMKVFGRRSCPEELIDLTRSIAKKCSGLPLSIVVVAGALRRSTNRIDWILVERHVGEHLLDSDDPNSSLKFVKMSYDCLPQEMQSCFLYCAIFPLGFDIPAWKLICLWIAEGLIKSKPGITLEETAHFYLNDLVNRSLVMVMQKKSDGRIKTCRIQDMLHGFCRVEASRKWFFQEIHQETDKAIISIHDPSASRRLCIQSSALYDFLSARPFAEHVRSFYCFSTTPIELPSGEIKSMHKAFPLIRVLDVESLRLLLTREFYQLFHLRYIALSGDFKHLPMPFGKFWNLQTLIFNASTSETVIEIKADIWNMLRLRHIRTNVPARLPYPSTSTGKGSSLQTLSHVAPQSCRKEMLAKARNLKKLSIRGQLIDFLGRSKGYYVNLEELKYLEELKLLNDSFLADKVLQLPSRFFNYVHSLKKLTLSGTKFDWSEANNLGQLESLEVLKLKENAFTGKSWKPETGGFSQLQVLWINTTDLETWEASEHHFPRLRSLVLISCVKLEAIPYELADARRLQEIRLENTIKAVKSAKEIASKKLESKFKLSIYPPRNSD